MNNRRRIYYCLLSIVTACVMVAHYFAVNFRISYPVSSASQLRFTHTPKASEQALGFVLNQGDKASLFCQASSSLTDARCQFAYSLLSDSAKPIDLSHFEYFTVDISQRSAAAEVLVIDLFTQDKTQGQPVSRRYRYALALKEGRHQYSFPISDFYQPLSSTLENLSSAYSSEPLKHVSELRLSTSYNSSNMELSFYSMRVSGYQMPFHFFYMGLLLLWLSSISIQYFLVARKVKDQNKKSQEIVEEQEKINRYLSIERDNYEFMAKIDPLTNCLNRAGMRNIFRDVIIDYLELGLPASLILFDIDHFKKVNDQYGHDEGDQVLIKIAQVVRQHIREDDYLARWGGEEFLIVCHHTRVSGGQALAEHLRVKIEASVLSEHCRITSSFGVAQLNSGNLEGWIKQADDALYQAKEAGRNQVKWAS